MKKPAKRFHISLTSMRVLRPDFSINFSEQKKKNLSTVFLFFFVAHIKKKKRNKRVEISTPSSRYLLQKPGTKLRHLFDRKFPILRNEYYRNEIALRNAYVHLYDTYVLLENFKIQRRKKVFNKKNRRSV